MSYFITTKYYLKRAFTAPLQVALMVGLPTVIIVLNIAMNLNIIGDGGGTYMVGDYNIPATVITMLIVLMFQFMSGVYSGEYVFEDFREANRWRLMAAPVPPSAYVFGAITASLIFSLASAVIVLVISFLVFDIYLLGNLGIVIPVVVLAALMAQFWGIIIALFVKKKGSIDGISIVISFAMSALIGGFMINVPAPEFFRHYLIPTGVAFRAVEVSGFMAMIEPGTYSVSDAFIYVGILVIMAVVSGVAALIIARRRKL